MKRKDKDLQIFIHYRGSIVADTSSLIYMGKTEILETYARFKQLVVSEHVYNELMTGSSDTNRQKEDDISIYKTLLFDTIHKCSETLQCCCITDEMMRNRLDTMTPADAWCIYLYYANSHDGVLTDDGDLVKLCRNYKIPHMNTPMALYSMYYAEVISREVYREKLEAVYAIGRYSRRVKEFMANLEKSGKSITSDNVYYVN